MTGKTKKFSVLKNIKSLLIRQPVLSSDKSTPPPQSDIVAEAERILEHYLQRMGYEKRAKKKRTTSALLGTCLILGFLAASYFIIRFAV